MAAVLLATDADWVHDEVFAALDGSYTVSRVRAGAHVQDAVAELKPAVVLLDLQIGNMGGMATCVDLSYDSLDLDLILFGNERIREAGLVVPHPRFRDRPFVLEPLAEIAPGWIDPDSGETISALAARARGRPS